MLASEPTALQLSLRLPGLQMGGGGLTPGLATRARSTAWLTWRSAWRMCFFQPYPAGQLPVHKQGHCACLLLALSQFLLTSFSFQKRCRKCQTCAASLFTSISDTHGRSAPTLGLSPLVIHLLSPGPGMHQEDPFPHSWSLTCSQQQWQNHC